MLLAPETSRPNGAASTPPAPDAIPHVEPADAPIEPALELDVDLAAQLVAVLFVAAGPVALTDAAHALDITVDEIERVVADAWQAPPRGLQVVQHGTDLRLVTAAATATVVERFVGTPPPVRLSRAALEALAVVAYRQPVTRAEIESVRGLNSDRAIATLLQRSLITEVGRRDGPGRPTLLATTPDFLHWLGLRTIGELPPLPTG